MVLHYRTQQVGDGGQLPYSAIDMTAPVGSGSEIQWKYLFTPDREDWGSEEIPNLDALLRALPGRNSSKPLGKVCAIAFPFSKHDH